MKIGNNRFLEKPGKPTWATHKPTGLEPAATRRTAYLYGASQLDGRSTCWRTERPMVNKSPTRLRYQHHIRQHEHQKSPPTIRREREETVATNGLKEKHVPTFQFRRSGGVLRQSAKKSRIYRREEQQICRVEPSVPNTRGPRHIRRNSRVLL